jgi:hypothetical protein
MMTASKKRMGFASLVIAGALSFLSSLFGCLLIVAYLWQQYPAKEVVPFLLLVLEVPMFGLVLLVSKRFIAGLWGMAVVYPLAVLLLAADALEQKALLIVVVGVGTISFVLLAALLRYGTTFEEVPPMRDSMSER